MTETMQDDTRRVRPTLRARLVASFGTCAWSTGLLFGWVSLYPTLLPRSGMIQGVITALCVTIGLAIGTLLALITRSLWTFTGRPVPVIPHGWGRRIVLGLTVLAVVIGLPWWLSRQNSQRSLVSMEHESAAAILTVVLVAAILALVLIVIGRTIAQGVRRLDGALVSKVPRWAATIATVVIVAATVSILAQRVVWTGFVNWANGVYGTFDDETPPGITPPTSALRSGGPGSLVAWDTLGYEGRNFAGGGPTVAQIQEFVGTTRTAKEPIRAYVGIRSVDVPADSDSLAEVEAQRAVAELDRAGAWDRSVLAVVTVTGTGWVDPYFAAGLEYMNAGDTAIVGTQYSYLPSWISFLVDLDKASANGRALTDAVVAKWETLPADTRPRLIVDGISLGSYGSEHAFNGSDLAASLASAAKADGVLWSGPTFMNPIWEQVVAGRDAGSPSWRPVVDDGRTVHAWNRPQDTDVVPGGRLPGRNIVYLTQPSDPVTWAGYSALWSKPEWMRGERGYDVPSGTFWLPGVTMVQEVFDLMAGFSTPPGHGHNYNASIVYGIAAVTAPSGWTASDSARLTEHLTSTVQ